MRNEFRNEPRTYTKIICNQITEGLRLLSRELYKTFHLWKRTISFKSALVGDMLLPRKVCFEHLWLLYIFTNKKLLVPTRTNKKHWHLYIYIYICIDLPLQGCNPPTKKMGIPMDPSTPRMFFFFFRKLLAPGAMKAYSFAACVRLGVRLGIFFTFPRKALLEDGTNKLFGGFPYRKKHVKHAKFPAVSMGLWWFRWFVFSIFLVA